MPTPYFAPLPGYFDRMIESERRIIAETGNQGNRVHWSGLGGDELLGGLQNPVPNLATLLWRLRLPSYWRQTEAWALQRKTTIWSLLVRSITSLMPIWIQSHFDRDRTSRMASWLQSEFVKQQSIAQRRIRIIRKWTDSIPGPESTDSSYLALASSIAGYLPRFSFTEQMVLPYYERDLVQFLISLPGEKLLRPHQRRSLMRRALPAVVPDVVLSRTSKALGRRTPAMAMLDHATELHRLLRETGLTELYIDSVRFEEDFAKLRQGKEVATLLLERVLGTCLLVQQLTKQQLIRLSPNIEEDIERGLAPLLTRSKQ